MSSRGTFKSSSNRPAPLLTSRPTSAAVPLREEHDHLAPEVGSLSADDIRTLTERLRSPARANRALIRSLLAVPVALARFLGRSVRSAVRFLLRRPHSTNGSTFGEPPVSTLASIPPSQASRFLQAHL